MKIPKYEQILEAMLRDIKESGIQPHEVFITDREAVERYGASRITVRRAISQLENDGLLYRVRGQGTRISPNKGVQLKFLAFLGESLVQHGIEPILLRGIEDYLVGHNANLIICNTNNDPVRAKQYLQRLTQIDVDGVIWMPLLNAPEKNIEIAHFLKSKKIPFVVTARTIVGLEDQIFSVIADNYSGGWQVTQHLISLGHLRIAFYHVLDTSVCTSLANRFKGYVAALEDAHIKPDPELDVCAPLSHLSVIIQRWQSMAEPPTAVFVDNDVTMISFMETAHALGVQIPEMLSVAGFDDLLDLQAYKPFTTVKVPHYEIGQMAVSQLVAAIQDRNLPPHQTLVPVNLVIRKTTGINHTLRVSRQPR